MGAVAKPLSRSQARKLTDAVRDAAEETWRLLSLAYDQRAWEPLGYQSWGAYVTAEFGMTDRNARLLLDQAHVIGELEAAARGALPAGQVSGRAAQALKADLPSTAAAVSDAVAGAEPEERAAAASAVIEKAAQVGRERKRASGSSMTDDASTSTNADPPEREPPKIEQPTLPGGEAWGRVLTMTVFELVDVPREERRTLQRRLAEADRLDRRPARGGEPAAVSCPHPKPMRKQVSFGTICDAQAGGCGAKVT